jgi:hypothetical protein
MVPLRFQFTTIATELEQHFHLRPKKKKKDILTQCHNLVPFDFAAPQPDQKDQN